MNKTVNNSLLAGDKSIPEIYLTHPGLTYSTCRPFTKHEERIETFKETVDSRYIYQNELDKAYCQHDMAYGDFKDLTRRSALIKCWVMKHFILLQIRNMTDNNADLLRWPINVLIKKLLKNWKYLK